MSREVIIVKASKAKDVEINSLSDFHAPMSNESNPNAIDTSVIHWSSRRQRAIQEEFQRLEEQNIFSFAPFPNNTLPILFHFDFVTRNHRTKARLVLRDENARY